MKDQLSSNTREAKQINISTGIIDSTSKIHKEKPHKEIEFLAMFIQTQNMMNEKKLLTRLSDYEQEIYEKDQYILWLENEIGRLKVSSYDSIKENIR